jgi:cytochrome P450
MAFAETMRLFPSPAVVAHSMLDDVHFTDGCTIPSNSIVNFLTLHRRPDTRDDPDDFQLTRWSRQSEWYNPDAWLESSLCPSLQSMSFCYAPFAADSRSCVEATFAAL